MMTDKSASMSSHQRGATWHDLPMEVIIQIVRRQRTRDALALSLTCRLYHTSLSDIILTNHIHFDPRAERLLPWAVDHDSLPIAKKALSSGLRVNWGRQLIARTPARLNAYCYSPLLRAIQRKNLAMVELLLEYGADVLVHTEDDTALTLAVRMGCLDIATRLLDHAFSRENKDNDQKGHQLSSSFVLANLRPSLAKMDALHHAAMAGDIPMLQLLLEYGADREARDAWGNTPLHTAIAESKTAAAAFLLHHGADSTAVNNDGKSVLSLAARMRQATTEERIELVLQIIDVSNSSAQDAIDTGPRISSDQASELLASGQESIIKLVLDAGHAADTKSSLDGSTPLWNCASLLAPPWGDGPKGTDGVALLLDAGADVNFAHPTTRETPAMRAARHGRGDVLRLLLSHGADVTARDHHQGMTLLAHAAAAKTGIDALRTLLSYDQQDDGKPGHVMAAQLEVPDDDGYTPLIHALQTGRFTAAAMLIRAGADVRVRGRHGQTALCLATERHPLEPAELILERLAADKDGLADGVDAPTIYGETALMRAVSWRCRDGALLLIAAGADVDTRRTCQVKLVGGGVVEEWEETPLVAAVHKGDAVLAGALLEAGASLSVAMELRPKLFRDAWGSKEANREDVVRLLERHGAREIDARLVERGVLSPRADLALVGR